MKQRLQRSLSEELICHKLYSIGQNNSVSVSYRYENKRLALLQERRIEDNKYNVLYRFLFYYNVCLLNGYTHTLLIAVSSYVLRMDIDLDAIYFTKFHKDLWTNFILIIYCTPCRCY